MWVLFPSLGDWDIKQKHLTVMTSYNLVCAASQCGNALSNHTCDNILHAVWGPVVQCATPPCALFKGDPYTETRTQGMGIPLA